MHHMIFDCLRIYQDVVQEDNNEVVQVVGKYVIHQVHKLHQGIRDSKGSDKELVQSQRVLNAVFGNVLFPQRYLLKPGSKIDAVVDCGTS